MTTTEAKADAAMAMAGTKAQGGDAADDLFGQLVAQAREKGLDLVGEGGLVPLQKSVPSFELGLSGPDHAAR